MLESCPHCQRPVQTFTDERHQRQYRCWDHGEVYEADRAAKPPRNQRRAPRIGVVGRGNQWSRAHLVVPLDGARLRELREAAGLLPRELAALSGLTTTCIRDWERLSPSVVRANLERVAGVLGVTLGDLTLANAVSDRTD
jgi:ribosome-binding protein aMBF1 (putative translation factor)